MIKCVQCKVQHEKSLNWKFQVLVKQFEAITEVVQCYLNREIYEVKIC